MPGIFGGVGCTPATYQRLELEFARVFREYALRQVAEGVVGGHAFHPSGALREVSGGGVLAVDGERSLYESTLDATSRETPVFQLSSGFLDPVPSSVGNMVLLSGGAAHLAADWSGTFPLYYAESAGGLLFSSHLRPLARVVGAEPDAAGTLEFLREGYTYGARTPFRGILRLLPGESLRFRPGEGIRSHHRSQAWVGLDERVGENADTAAELAWEALAEVIRGWSPDGRQATLMMSAGWDSRTLLAATRALGTPEHLDCYSHGDVEGRELRLVGRICGSSGVACRQTAVDDSQYDLDLLHDAFARTENVVFPHWHRAGRLIRDSGSEFVFAGVFGEMLGGRYWLARAHDGSALRKAAVLFGSLLGGKRVRPEPPLEEARRQARDLFHLRALGRPWYLAAEASDSLGEAREEINADVEDCFQRLETRGVGSLNQLVEAFLVEHLGSRYCNAQLLSCRSSLDIALPLANREILRLASRFPIGAKIQNAVNRRILRRIDPQLLRYPLAATLVAAGAPVPIQEASRVLRHVAERGRWELHLRTRGRVGPPRLGWANFEFLRSGRALRAMVDDLRSDLWDRQALDQRLAAVEAGTYRGLFPLSDQVAKILTIDLLLR